MSIFRRKPTAAPQRSVEPCCPEPLPVEFRTSELRPCIAGGRRAVFHRWINIAHPVPPRGSEITENTRYFQYRRTEALVEYEDGTVDRVFPTELQFLDGGAFARFDWSGADAEGVNDVQG